MAQAAQGEEPPRGRAAGPPGGGAGLSWYARTTSTATESGRVSGNEEEGEGISFRSIPRPERASWFWLLCGGGALGLRSAPVESDSSMIIGETAQSDKAAS